MTPASYIATVLAAYQEVPAARRPHAGDRPTAAALHRSVPLDPVRSAHLLATLRRRLRSADALPLPPVRSLAYYLPVIQELLETPLAPGYLRYLELRARHGEQGWRSSRYSPD